MVQLKSQLIEKHLTTAPPFQFLYGTIKISLFSLALAANVRFNSSMVQLKCIKSYERPVIEAGFNSSMVQLKCCCYCSDKQSYGVSIPLWYN